MIFRFPRKSHRKRLRKGDFFTGRMWISVHNFFVKKVEKFSPGRDTIIKTVFFENGFAKLTLERRVLMRTYRIFQVDSFARRKLAGNPAGVVLDARGLSDEEMRQIARELNNSETAFILPGGSGYDVEVRFFTPACEVPICGHATIAAHYVRARELGLSAGTVVQKTKAGILPVQIVQEGSDRAIVMTQAAPAIAEPLDPALIARVTAALGFSPDQLRPDCPVCVASTGSGKLMLGIRSTELLHALDPDLAALKELTPLTGGSGYYVFTLHPGEEALVHGRMFNPASGIPEDPVTGNANGPLGAYLVHFGLFQEGVTDEFRFSIVQGEAIRRAGTMDVIVSVKDGEPQLVRIAGRAVIAFETVLELE